MRADFLDVSEPNIHPVWETTVLLWISKLPWLKQRVPPNFEQATRARLATPHPPPIPFHPPPTRSRPVRVLYPPPRTWSRRRVRAWRPTSRRSPGRGARTLRSSPKAKRPRRYAACVTLVKSSDYWQRTTARTQHAL